jgi:predicted nucleic acid-binding Zn ribbon protein
MKKEKASPLSDVLKKVVSTLGERKLTEEKLVDAWEKAAGKKAAKHTRPVGLRRASLTVNVDSSSWLFELTLKKRAILEKLQAKLEGEKLKAIRFRIGDIKR